MARAEHASLGESVTPDAIREYASISPQPGRPDPSGSPSLNRLTGHVRPVATSRSTTLGPGVPTCAGLEEVGGENSSPAPSRAPSPKFQIEPNIDWSRLPPCANRCIGRPSAPG